MIDVLGRDLEEARRVLGAAGADVTVIETRAPRRPAVTGPLRVIRQRETAMGQVELVVTHERYELAPRTRGG